MKQFTCAYDIKEYLSWNIQKQEKIYDELDCIKIGLFNPKKDELKSRKKELKNELEKLKSKMLSCKRILENYTTFNRNQLLPFLTAYLSLIESKKFISADYIEELPELTLKGTYKMHYDVITTLENKIIIDKNWNEENIYDSLALCKDKKSICLFYENTYTLLDGFELNDSFRNFPYLLKAVYEILDVRLANLEISDGKLLSIVLTNLYNSKKMERNK